MKKLGEHLAEQMDGFSALVEQLGLTVLEAPSFKAAFDIRWSHTDERNDALNKLVAQANRLIEQTEHWLEDHPDDQEAKARLELLEVILDQNLEPDPDGTGQVRIKVNPRRNPFDRQSTEFNTKEPERRPSRRTPDG